MRQEVVEFRHGQKKIALTTLGSLGDLHPCIALGKELQLRGHKVRIITTEFYRDKVEQTGIEFRPMRPDWDPTAPDLIGQCEDLKNGPEILFRKLILPHLRSTYEDLLAAAADADWMLAGELGKLCTSLRPASLLNKLEA